MENKLNFWEKFARVQYEIKVQKDKIGSNGQTQYKYRDKEAIILAVKEILHKYGLIVYTDNDVIEVGGKLFVQTKATVTDGAHSITSKGWALMEDLRIQGSKLTGSAITYSERYALASLFLVCDHTPNIEDYDDKKTGKDINQEGSQENAFNKMNRETDKHVLLPIYEKYALLGQSLNQEEKKVLYKIYKKYIPENNKNNGNVDTRWIFQSLDPIFDFDHAE